MSAGELSKARLADLHDTMAGHVERGAVPGMVTLVSRGDETDVHEIGTTAFGGAEPMRRDTIFRIASLTKPIAAAAAMVLVEEGRLRLDEPVERLLPELADRRVLPRLDGPLDDTVPADRSITLRDLLALRMGFGYVVGPAPSYPIAEAAGQLRLGMGPPDPATQPAPDEWMRRFATLPLMHQPGEKWAYDLGFRVLGVLIARAAGQPLDAVLRDRILDPLGMTDTGFSVPTASLDRLPTCYQVGQEEALEVYDGAAAESRWSRLPDFPDASGGLVSTADDYLAFALMMLNGGEYRGTRVLSRRSVELMTTDHLTAEQRSASESVPVFLGDSGWGFGVEVIPANGGAAARYGWGGGLGTFWYSVPQDETVAILMTQRLPPSPDLAGDFGLLSTPG